MLIVRVLAAVGDSASVVVRVLDSNTVLKCEVRLPANRTLLNGQRERVFVEACRPPSVLLRLADDVRANNVSGDLVKHDAIAGACATRIDMQKRDVSGAPPATQTESQRRKRMCFDQ